MKNPREITMDDIYVPVSMADKLVSAFEEQYFTLTADSFEKDENVKLQFVCDYEYMQAQIWSIGQLLFDTRVKLELALGIKSAAALTHIKNEEAMLNMHKEVWEKSKES